MERQANPDEVADAGSEGFWHAVDFKHDCPHVGSASVVAMARAHTAYPSTGCAACDDKRETWFCLHCGLQHCSRYVQGHAVKHAESESHPLAISVVDLSLWCFECDSYIISPLLLLAVNSLHIAKYGVPHPQAANDPLLRCCYFPIYFCLLNTRNLEFGADGSSENASKGV